MRLRKKGKQHKNRNKWRDKLDFYHYCSGFMEVEKSLFVVVVVLFVSFTVNKRKIYHRTLIKI